MAAWSQVGTITQPTTTGAQAITGLPGTPSALLLWTHGNETNQTWEGSGLWGDTPAQGMRRSFGMYGGSVSAAQAVALGQVAGSPKVTDTRIESTTGQLGYLIAPNGTDTDIVTLSSLDANGFTLNWTTVSARQYIWNYMALGGDDIDAKVVSWTTPSTGVTGNTAVTGAGFLPSAVLHLTGAHTASASSCFGVGAMDAAGGQWATATTFNDGQGTIGGTRRLQSTSAALMILSTGTGNPEGYASFTSMDSDGFTVNIGNDFSGNRIVYSLCLSGADLEDVKVGNSAKPTGSAPATHTITGLGFQPDALLAVSLASVANGLTGSDDIGHNVVSMGAADDLGHQVQSGMRQSDTNGDRRGIYSDNAALVVTGGETDVSSTTANRATLTSLDSDGMTLSWSPNAAVANLLLYVAFGLAPTAGIANRIDPTRLTGRLGGIIG